MSHFNSNCESNPKPTSVSTALWLCQYQEVAIEGITGWKYYISLQKSFEISRERN